MSTIALINQKGGVGKTTLTMNIAGACAVKGLRVLMVDNDPQASLTQAFLGSDQTLRMDPDHTLAAVYRGDRIDFETLAAPTGFEGMHLIPGSVILNEFNRPGEEAVACRRQVLSDMLFGAADAYDLVLIDCPPNVLECSHQALYASDGVVIPLIPDDFGVQGITPVLAAIGRVKRVNHRLCLVGYLLNRFRARLSLHRLYADELDDAYGVDCFTPRVPDTIAFATALLERKPVTHAAPKSPAALAMGVVVDDLLSRISERCGIGAHRPIREVV